MKNNLKNPLVGLHSKNETPVREFDTCFGCESKTG